MREINDEGKCIIYYLLMHPIASMSWHRLNKLTLHQKRIKMTRMPRITTMSTRFCFCCCSAAAVAAAAASAAHTAASNALHVATADDTAAVCRAVAAWLAACCCLQPAAPIFKSTMVSQEMHAKMNSNSFAQLKVKFATAQNLEVQIGQRISRNAKCIHILAHLKFSKYKSTIKHLHTHLKTSRC